MDLRSGLGKCGPGDNRRRIVGIGVTIADKVCNWLGETHKVTSNRPLTARVSNRIRMIQPDRAASGRFHNHGCGPASIHIDAVGSAHWQQTGTRFIIVSPIAIAFMMQDIPNYKILKVLKG